ncbi:hypothetical protein BKA67DRAFT_584833 [Truncatella angustata]|uniref:Uncharacterized protein n=1 Tax=Truncatella angustata TaxID=152316 RepID=A0A9P8UBG4_9PEZI|nr:uncharacterized protein BKA67DRAFT_584833 [Truncatella angustata]KAH6645351.1 hypothetical protein BKA67DRAFT_584833 [Truncatella angustata]
MNEKLPAVVGHIAPESLWRRAQSSLIPLRQTLLLILTLSVVYSVYRIPILKECLKQPLATETVERVPLEIHIITKCGNARTALTDLLLPTIERVYDKVDFRLSIVARPTEDGIVCKHGPEECKASIMELCAQETHPDSRTYIGFIECLTHEYERIPERAHYEVCASKFSVDLEAVDQCATRDGGAYGFKLLRESAQHTIDAGVRISGTVRLNEKIYCIRDGDNWTDCPNGPSVDNLVDAIEHFHNATTSDL